jgi:hypothetical protein
VSAQRDQGRGDRVRRARTDSREQRGGGAYVRRLASREREALASAFAGQREHQAAEVTRAGAARHEVRRLRGSSRARCLRDAKRQTMCAARHVRGVHPVMLGTMLLALAFALAILAVGERSIDAMRSTGRYARLVTCAVSTP